MAIEHTKKKKICKSQKSQMRCSYAILPTYRVYNREQS